MSGQAEQLQQAVAFFRLEAGKRTQAPSVTSLPARKPAARNTNPPKARPRVAGNLALVEEVRVDESQFTKF
jgi:methyl-accepting chemotaxis protein